jgi:hypothetical protein
MLLKIQLCFLLLFPLVSIYAQDEIKNNNSSKENTLSEKAKSKKGTKGGIEVFVSPEIENILNRDTELNKENGLIEGYRVQLFFGSGPNSKQKAIEIQNAFKAKYSDVPDYLVFHSPHFKVRVGDFRTRLEALQFQKKVEADFPTSFVVKDDITGAFISEE